MFIQGKSATDTHIKQVCMRVMQGKCSLSACSAPFILDLFKQRSTFIRVISSYLQFQSQAKEAVKVKLFAESETLEQTDKYCDAVRLSRYFYSATFQREILIFLFHNIFLTAFITFITLIYFHIFTYVTFLKQDVTWNTVFCSVVLDTLTVVILLYGSKQIISRLISVVRT